jgi:hypothetical protein
LDLVVNQTTETDLIRRAFVARFGEDDAKRIEDAAQGHYVDDQAMLHALAPDLPTPHGRDGFGSNPFQYWFLLAIGRGCLTKFRTDHGITATEDELRQWALAEGNLAEYDGDIPDYIAVIAGLYGGWVNDDK